MTLVANSQGVVTGSFQIPANIPAGAKDVVFTGRGGTRARATFTGRGTITTETRRVVNTVTNTRTTTTTTITNPNPAAWDSIDPLAQTFILPESRHIAGVDLWFTNAGDKDCTVQIRTVESGFPTRNALAEKRLKPSEINANGNATRVLFPWPVYLSGGAEYAIVVLTDSATTALSVAELGKFDASNQQWVTAQPYQVGVLLSSSNAMTWTAHQNADLTFRLLAAKFSQTSKTVALGTVAASSMTDMLARFTAEVPAAGAGFKLTATAGGASYELAPSDPVALSASFSGSVALSMTIEGTEKVSPVLYPGMIFAAGTQAATGTYVTRKFANGNGGRIAVRFEALTPGTSSVDVAVQKADGTWQTMTLTSGSEVGDGWVERAYVLTGFTAPETAIRLTLNGTPQYRPRVRKLRAVSTD